MTDGSCVLFLNVAADLPELFPKPLGVGSAMLALIMLAIFVVLLFSLQVSFFGNPTYTLVMRAPQSLIDKAGICLREETPPDDEETRNFLAHFARWSIASFVLIGVELAVTLYFICTHPTYFVPWMIVAKYVVLFLYAMGIEWEEEATIVEQVARMPKQLVQMERFVGFLTAVGFGALLIKLLQGDAT